MKHGCVQSAYMKLSFHYYCSTHVGSFILCEYAPNELDLIFKYATCHIFIFNCQFSHV